jgi:hypothetical protein
VPRDYSVLLKSYHTHANVLVCLHGYDLPTAAQTAHVRLGNNTWAHLILNDLGVFLMFLGKVQVATLTALASYQFIEDGNEGASTEHNYGSWIVVMACFFIGWTCAAIVLSIYTSVSTAVTACVMEDREYNEIHGHPTFAPPGLINSLGAPPAVKRYADVFGGAGGLIDRITGGHIQRQTEEFLTLSVSGEQAGRAVGRLLDASLAWKKASRQVYDQFRENLQLSLGILRPGSPADKATGDHSAAPISAQPSAQPYRQSQTGAEGLAAAGASTVAPTPASKSRKTRKIKPGATSYDRPAAQSESTLSAGVVGTLVAAAEMFHTAGIADHSDPAALAALGMTLQQNVAPFIETFFGVSPVVFTEMVIGLIQFHIDPDKSPTEVVATVTPFIAKQFGVDERLARLGASFAFLIAERSRDPEVMREQVRLVADSAMDFIKERLGSNPFGLAMMGQPPPVPPVRSARSAPTPQDTGIDDGILIFESSTLHVATPPQPPRSTVVVPVYSDVPHGSWGRMTTI